MSILFLTLCSLALLYLSARERSDVPMTNEPSCICAHLLGLRTPPGQAMVKSARLAGCRPGAPI
jgi:hypothetical protein